MKPPLSTLTIPLSEAAADGAFLELLRAPEVKCWTRRGEGLVAFGEVARFGCRGPERFADAAAWWSSLLAGATHDDGVRLPGTGAIAFGSFAFSKTSGHESRLVVPRLVAGLRDGTAWLSILSSTGERLTPALARAEFDAARTRLEPPPSASTPTLVAGTLGEANWMDAVASAVRTIGGGGLEKVVLARDVAAVFDSPPPRGAILASLADRYSECWTYGVDGLVGSTPEMLVRVMGTTASARVLAGTLDRVGAPADGDAYARAVLAGSDKQRGEHELAVRSLTRQLAPFATDLAFPPEPFILKLPNVWHLASDVYAELADFEGHLPSSLALVEALHPTAAVCGTPRTEAGILIRELERMDRGPYAGPVGWLDSAGNGEWGIALRGAVIEDPHTVRLYAGCGIVAASDPAAELAETWAKFRPMLQALGLHA
ncbi:MAG: isochorismate synthase MenF [Actinomycetales bacterium]